uniref:NADH-ubiquinone oxidoreductase chain 2 n=1 Tax=Anodontites trapesialis TaxID=1961152 RepID=A0A1X9JRS4_9BIVA|nr:NADH dehydrogenase subunit 2 [Anodontites trapesialis]
MKSPHKTLFTITLITSTILVISSSNWITIWMGLEINMLSFIPLMMKSNTNNEPEAAVKYLVPQSLASALFITASLLSMTFKKITNLMTVSMALKLGIAPLHLWFPAVMASLPILPSLILLTWQKIAPMSTITLVKPTNPMIITFLIITTAMWGSIMGLNQTDIRSILTYSSISHLGWMLASTQSSTHIMWMYLITYILLTLSVFTLISTKQTKFTSQLTSLFSKNNDTKLISLAILSLAGLPPLTGFILKLIVILNTNINMIAISMLILGAMISLTFYLNLFMTTYTSEKLQEKEKLPSKTKTIAIFTLLQITPLPMMIMLL